MHAVDAMQPIVDSTHAMQ